MNKMQYNKIVLLNPPSKKNNYSRDYFCSKTLKANYIEHPIDLLILSGILYDAFKVEVLDATVLGLNSEKTFKKIRYFSPDVIIFISGLASWVNDFEFMKQIKKENPHLKLIGMGDIFWEKETFFDNSWIDAVLFDFTTKDIMNYLKGNHGLIKNMMFREGGNIICTEILKYDKEDFEIEIPRHELFLKKRYTFPFARKLPFATILTDYGCGFNCSFCIYGSLGFKLRKLENVFNELEYIHYLGIRELFIKDQTFGYCGKRAIKFCNELIRKDWNFSWTAFSRVDILDYELLFAMREAGCHTLIMGVETANENILKKYKKGVLKKKVEDVFELCRKLNIRTVATFILGFPQEDKNSMLKTIKFAKEINCDFASFNVFVPKTLSASKELEGDKDVKIGHKEWDQSGTIPVLNNGVVSGEEIHNLLVFAVKQFYLRPLYILNRIRRTVTFDELKMLIKNGIGLIKNFIRP